MFRFTIRDLLWLMLVVGMGITLVIQHQKASAARTKVRAALSRDLVQIIDFVEMPIDEAVYFISCKQEVPIFLADEVDDMKWVTGKFTKMPLGTALKQMLLPLDLDYQVEDGWILVNRRSTSS
jgi:hypothetical protein